MLTFLCEKNQLRARKSPMVLVEPSEAQTKALVRVQYKDSVWYPAHIIEVSGANEDGHPTHVKIHYGNSNKRYACD